MSRAAEQIVVTKTARGMTTGRKQFLTKRAAKCAVVSIEELEDAIEDAELNAIANVRAKGPFVRVSLDDL